MSEDENIMETIDCGSIKEHKEIRSALGPFRTFPDYTIIYPEVVIKALCNLYEEYNQAFIPLVATNREWETDYGLCMNGSFVNYCVQIDMVGLSEVELKILDSMSEIEVREILRKKIFEIENSIAMYQLLERIFSQNGHDSFFKIRFRAVLDDLRRRFDKPIALLAVTEEKYEAILASEFGRCPDEKLTNSEVKNLSGFDTLFSPQQFCEYLVTNNGECKHLLYVRSSDPIAKLKKPNLVVDHPLLSDSAVRRVIKANALTLNVDIPEMEYDRRINDTKDYMVEMNMAFPIISIEDLHSDGFREYLYTQGIDLADVESGKVSIRCKPTKGAYGCYGHVSGFLTEKKFSKNLKRNLRLRGPYVIQLEMITPIVVNSSLGVELTYIDRNFVGMINGHPQFIGGVRNLIPTDAVEAREHRIHGNSLSIYAEIKSMN
ncbi:MAG: hypothetical protein KAI71_06775 [Candidatus Pacebacteria bacterium]|nr:hypothetical protein [Candidatus Paceibacterota bacterium]